MGGEKPGEKRGEKRGDTVVVAQSVVGGRKGQEWDELRAITSPSNKGTGSSPALSQRFNGQGLSDIDPSLRGQGGAVGMYSTTAGLEDMAHVDADLLGLLDTLTWGYLDGEEQPFARDVPLGDLGESDPSTLFMEERGEVDPISRYFMGYI